MSESKTPKADANRRMREQKFEAEQARLRAMSAQPKRRSKDMKSKIKADVEAAEAKGKK